MLIPKTVYDVIYSWWRANLCPPNLVAGQGGNCPPPTPRFQHPCSPLWQPAHSPLACCCRIHALWASAEPRKWALTMTMTPLSIGSELRIYYRTIRAKWRLGVRNQCCTFCSKSRSWIPCKNVIPSRNSVTFHFLKNSFSDISRKCILPKND